jgi:hypothetical protein
MIRKGTDTKDFPVGPLSPVVVTENLDGIIEHKAYTFNSKETVESFVEDNLIFVSGGKNAPRTLLGIWFGEWKSEVFELDPDTFLQMVIEYGRKKFKTFKY